MAEVLELRAARQAPQVSLNEGDLLLRINAGLSEEVEHRSRVLGDKRRAEMLTTQEHAELLRLTETIERRQADRLAVLAELAQLRGTSLNTIMDQLGIRVPLSDQRPRD